MASLQGGYSISVYNDRFVRSLALPRDLSEWLFNSGERSERLYLAPQITAESTHASAAPNDKRASFVGLVRSAESSKLGAVALEQATHPEN